MYAAPVNADRCIEGDHPYAGTVTAHDSQIVAAAPSRDKLAPKISHLERSTAIVYRMGNRWMVR
jgi:hypothetical protein